MTDRIEHLVSSDFRDKLINLKTIVQLLEKVDLQVPRIISEEIITVKARSKELEKASISYKEITFRFSMITTNEDGQKVFHWAYNYFSEGQIVQKEDGMYLALNEPRRNMDDFLKLDDNFKLDESWMEEHSFTIVDEVESDDDWTDGWTDGWTDNFVDNTLPCDENPSDCGVTCFNCPIGN